MDFAKETYLTPEQVAEKLQLSITTIYNLIKAQDLPAIRLGKCYRIAQSALAHRLGQQVPTIPPAVTRLVERLRASTLAPLIEQVILFGSQARGEAVASSDIDLLLVLKTVSPKHRALLWQIEEEVDAEFGYVHQMEVLKFTQAEWAMQKREHTGLYRNVEQEGIALWP